MNIDASGQTHRAPEAPHSGTAPGQDAQTYDEMIEPLMDLVAYTPLQNGTGGPAISIPAGTAPTGLPIGLQFSAGHGEDGLLLRMAHQLASGEGR